MGTVFGRRRFYPALNGALGLRGAILRHVERSGRSSLLTGALSTEAVEPGPFTSLERVISSRLISIPKSACPHLGARNAVVTATGSLGRLRPPCPVRYVRSRRLAPPSFQMCGRRLKCAVDVLNVARG